MQLHSRYKRDQLASEFGVRCTRYWEQGVVRIENDYLLFVTLEKKDLPPDRRYTDRFVSCVEFDWQSQKRESRAGRGAKYQNRGERDARFHLLVRRSIRTEDHRSSPFVYLGQVRFVSWDGDHPINIRWKLDTAVPTELLDELKVALT
jgi:hypothetical protein